VISPQQVNQIHIDWQSSQPIETKLSLRWATIHYKKSRNADCQ